MIAVINGNFVSYDVEFDAPTAAANAMIAAVRLRGCPLTWEAIAALEDCATAQDAEAWFLRQIEMAVAA